MRSFAEKIIFHGSLHMAGYALKAQPNEGLLTGFSFFDFLSTLNKPLRQYLYQGFFLGNCLCLRVFQRGRAAHFP
ncbi:MAG: hypothetical protein LJE83_15290 [Gammaproteobacteria bacterium]|nr:hypothetical protein [Gammaproteobacteria bacterium]